MAGGNSGGSKLIKILNFQGLTVSLNQHLHHNPIDTNESCNFMKFTKFRVLIGFEKHVFRILIFTKNVPKNPEGSKWDDGRGHEVFLANPMQNFSENTPGGKVNLV